jgi:O-acetylserine/cysteine efflux transporter
MTQNMSVRDILTALAVVTIWGANFVAMKIGLLDLPPILLTALRFLFSALPLVFFVRRPQVAWRFVLAYGMFQFALQFTLIFTGIKLGLPAGLASLVVQLQVFFTIGLAVLMLDERPRLLQLAGALVALAGMGLVAINLEGQATLVGFMLALLGGMCWALANIVNRKMGPVNALSLVVWASLLATPPLLLGSWLVEGAAAWQLAASRFGPRAFGSVLFQAYPATIVGFGIWSMLMRRYAVSTVAPFSLLIPVAGMITATLVLGEPMQWWKIAAGMLVLSGLALNLFGGRLWALARAKR